MGYFYVYILVFLNLLIIAKGQFGIEIYRNVNDTEVPVIENVTQHLGTNLTLICKLTNVSSHSNDQLFWSKKETVVKNNELHQRGINYAVISFRPLFLYNSGVYFCTSVKYRLFKIINLRVTSSSQFNKNKKRRSLLRHCTDDKFSCDSGTGCVEYTFICDNVKDCNDGSDEGVKLCGHNPCHGKWQCSDGRCISESFCCDKLENAACRVKVRPPCCFELSNTTKINVAEVSDGSRKGTLSNFQIMWIVVICAITLVFATMCLVLIHSRSKETRNVSTKNAANKSRKNRDNKNAASKTDTIRTTSFISDQNETIESVIEK